MRVHARVRESRCRCSMGSRAGSQPLTGSERCRPGWGEPLGSCRRGFLCLPRPHPCHQQPGPALEPGALEPGRQGSAGPTPATSQSAKVQTLAGPPPSPMTHLTLATTATSWAMTTRQGLRIAQSSTKGCAGYAPGPLLCPIGYHGPGAPSTTAPSWGGGGQKPHALTCVPSPRPPPGPQT